MIMACRGRFGRSSFVVSIIAFLSAVLGGCAGFIDAELNNRGGFVDKKLDTYWMLADTKQMRVLRAYTIIGSLARMSRENYYKSERQLISQHVNTAINVAFDAYACAYSRPGECVYFDERMAELEVTVIRLAIAVFSQHENESLVGVVTTQASEAAPLLKALNSVGKIVDAFSSATDVAVSTGKLIKSLITFSENAYILGRRAGALYRDSIELAMIASLGSLDLQCTMRGAAPGKKLDDETKTYYQFYGVENAGLDPCGTFKLGLKAWNQGSGDLANWKGFLTGPLVPFRQSIIPGESAFIQASDLIWRACEQIAETPVQLATCLGHRGLEAKPVECGVDTTNKRNAVETPAQVTLQKAVDAKKDLNKKSGGKTKNELEEAFNSILVNDQCRLILYAKTWGSRQARRGQADARVYWLSAPKDLPNRAWQMAKGL